MQSRVYRYYDRLDEIDMQLSGIQQPTPNDKERKSFAQDLIYIEANLHPNHCL